VLPVRTGIQEAINGMAFTVFPATESRQQKSKVKTMLIAFDSNGIIHKAFVPAGQTVNSAFYEEVLKRLLRRIHRLRPQLRRTGQWMLLHNAPAHCPIRVCQFLAQRGVPLLDHPPYYPDLAHSDLFPRLKSIVKGARFADVAAIQERVTAVLRSIPTEALAEFPEAL